MTSCKCHSALGLQAVLHVYNDPLRLTRFVDDEGTFHVDALL
jgi:hypothetical protein